MRGAPADGPGVPLSYFQRAFAALLAISFRRLGDMPLARASPPLRLSATAAGSFPSDFGGRHVIGNLAGRDPHDVDGVADHVGGTALAFWGRGLGALLNPLKLVLNLFLKLQKHSFYLRDLIL
jgi:hypothetical protein